MVDFLDIFCCVGCVDGDGVDLRLIFKVVDVLIVVIELVKLVFLLWFEGNRFS